MYLFLKFFSNHIFTTFVYMATEYAIKTFENINAAKFFSKYLPSIRNVKHKMRGTDGNGKPIDFSDTEKKEIFKALNQMCKDLKSKQ